MVTEEEGEELGVHEGRGLKEEERRTGGGEDFRREGGDDYLKVALRSAVVGETAGEE